MSHRHRIQSLNSRLNSQQRSSSQESLDKLQVVIPPKTTNVDSCLRPIQTNIRREVKKDLAKLQPIKKPTYQLVRDQDVPTIIKDYKRRIQYKKLESLGSVSYLLTVTCNVLMCVL